MLVSTGRRMEYSLPAVQLHGLSKAVCVFTACAFFILTFNPVSTLCPAQCACSQTTTGRQSISCDPGLTSFPLNLPPDTEVIALSPLPGQSANNIQSLKVSDFDGLSDAARIVIRRSNVQNIEPGAFANLKVLLSLDLRDNQLQRMSKFSLTGLTRLVSLDISDNKGCAIDVDAFEEVPALRTLRLGNIGLRSIDGLFQRLSALRYLDLHGNNLFRLQGNSLLGLANLIHLDLSFNDLYGVNEMLAPVFTNLNALDLDSNPWRCNCALSWLKTIPRKFVAPAANGGVPVVCAAPARLAHLDVWKVEDVDMRCSPARITHCTGPVTVWQGGTFSITCDVEGDPFPDVFWIRPDGTKAQLDLTFSTTDSVTLTINSASYGSHHGHWNVTAESYNTTSSVTVSVTVIVPSTTPSFPRTGTTVATGGNGRTTTTGKSTNFINTGSSGKNSQVYMPSTSKQTIPSQGPSLWSSNLKSKPTFSNNERTPPTASGKTGEAPDKAGSETADSKDDESKMETNSDSSGSFSGNNNINASKESRVDHNTIILAAIVSSSVVFIVGMIIFAVTIYKVRLKRQVHARRRRASAEMYRYNSTLSRGTGEDIVVQLKPVSTRAPNNHQLSTIFGHR